MALGLKDLINGGVEINGGGGGGWKGEGRKILGNVIAGSGCRKFYLIC